MVLTKITRNGVKVEINDSHPVSCVHSTPRKAVMIDSMCQTTCTSATAALEPCYENVYDVTSNTAFNSASQARDTTNNVADKSCHSPFVARRSPNVLQTSQIETSCKTDNLSSLVSTNSKTHDFSSSSLGIKINNVTSLQEVQVSCAGTSTECSENSQPMKVDTCVQVTSAKTITRKSVAANTICVHAGTHFAVTQDADAHTQMQHNYDYTRAGMLPSSPNYYPEQQQSQPVSSPDTNWEGELQIDTTNQESEGEGVEPSGSPKLLKKRHSTEELCKKITNTRERMRNEQIPWKRKVLLRLQMVLVKRLRKCEVETGEKATLDIDEIEAECLEKLKNKPANQHNGSKKTSGKNSKEGTEHHPKQKGKKQKRKKPQDKVETAKTKPNKRKFIETLLKENCVQHYSLERAPKLHESATQNDISPPASTESSFSQLESTHKGCVSLNSAWQAETDRNKVKHSPTHSRIKKSKSFPNSDSPAYRAQGKQFVRQVSCPNSTASRKGNKTSKPKTLESINERRPSGETSKPKSIFAATSSFLSFKKNAMSKNPNSTRTNNSHTVKSGSLEYHSPSVTKQNKTPELRPTKTSGDTSYRIPKRSTSLNEISTPTRPDLQRDNAKKISSWGGAIKPQPAEVSLHNSLPGGSHSTAKYDKIGVKRHWLMCATDS